MGAGVPRGAVKKAAHSFRLCPDYRDVAQRAKAQPVPVVSGPVAAEVAEAGTSTGHAGPAPQTRAYSGGDAFGPEALKVLQVLLKRAEDDRDRLVVILVGYQAEIAQLLATNPGLSSRFTTRVEFPSYSGAELLQIARVLLVTSGDVLAPEAESLLAGLSTWPSGKAGSTNSATPDSYENSVSRRRPYATCASWIPTTVVLRPVRRSPRFSSRTWTSPTAN